MLTEPLTDTQTALSTCTEAALQASTDPDWLKAQQDRLMGYEILMRTLTADPTPMTPGQMSDCIGLNKGCSWNLLREVQERLYG